MHGGQACHGAAGPAPWRLPRPGRLLRPLPGRARTSTSPAGQVAVKSTGRQKQQPVDHHMRALWQVRASE